MLNTLRLLYIASPALPIGGFAWSHGLSQACASNLVTDVASLRNWLETILHYGIGRADLPLLMRAFKAAVAKNAESYLHWNNLIFSGRETAELWLEEEAMGEAIKRLLLAQKLMPTWLGEHELVGHVAAFALLAVQLGGQIRAADAVAASYAWSWLENQIIAAAKCIPLGQNAAQSILLSFMADIRRLVVEAKKLPDSEIGSSLAGLALASSRHEEQHSRMFRS